MSRSAACAVLLALASGCVDPAAGDFDEPPPGPVIEGPWPAATAACAIDPVEPTRLVVTTTDFSTGAIAVADLAARTVVPDVAVGSTDAIPYAIGDHLVVVHRYGLDYLDVLDAGDLAPRGQFPLPRPAAGSVNPHAIAFDPRGRAYVTSLGTRELYVLDLAAAPASSLVGAIDLAAFADDDLRPEASEAVACGDLVYVGVQRLGPGFAPLGPDMLVPIDTIAGLPVDVDADAPGGQGLALAGSWLRQLRRDPADPDGRTLLALTTGIERVDLAAGTVSWALHEAVLAAAGFGERELLQAFDVDDAGTTAYVAAYEPGFAQVALLRVALDDPGAIPVRFADGMDSVERTLEVVGDALWYGSTRAGAAGLWIFDIGGDVPAIVAGPLSTGLPPYSLVALP